ncbi:MAG: AMP-binding protein, partial [Acidimicrobiales bacterium]
MPAADGAWLERIARHDTRKAIVDPGGAWSYDALETDATGLAAALLAGRDDLGEERVALLCAPGHDFVTGLLGCWAAGGLAVPLHPSHPEAELEYFLTDADAGVIV